MSGFIQQGVVNQVTTSGINQPTITGVTAGNTLISVYQSSFNSGGSFSAPTDSSGQTWTLRTQVNASGTNNSGSAIAYLLNANSGTHTLTWVSQAGPSEANITEWNGITGVGGAAPAGVVNNTGATTITTGSYTPSQANEVIIATGVSLALQIQTISTVLLRVSRP